MENVYGYGSWVIAGLAVYMTTMLAVSWWVSKRNADGSPFDMTGWFGLTPLSR